MPGSINVSSHTMEVFTETSLFLLFLERKTSCPPSFGEQEAFTSLLTQLCHKGSNVTRFESPLGVPTRVSTGENYSRRSCLVRSTYPAQKAPEEAEENFTKVLVSAHCWNSVKYRTFSQWSLWSTASVRVVSSVSFRSTKHPYVDSSVQNVSEKRRLSIFADI